MSRLESILLTVRKVGHGNRDLRIAPLADQRFCFPCEKELSRVRLCAGRLAHFFLFVFVVLGRSARAACFLTSVCEARCLATDQRSEFSGYSAAGEAFHCLQTLKDVCWYFWQVAWCLMVLRKGQDWWNERMIKNLLVCSEILFLHHTFPSLFATWYHNPKKEEVLYPIKSSQRSIAPKEHPSIQ